MTTPEDLRAIRELVAEANQTTMEMANCCSVDMETWDRHSNAVLKLARVALSAAEQGARAEEALEAIGKLALVKGQPTVIGPLYMVGLAAGLKHAREIAIAALPQSPSKVEEG